MVDILRADARLCRFPLSDPGRGHQSYHQGREHENSGKGAVSGLNVSVADVDSITSYNWPFWGSSMVIIS